MDDAWKMPVFTVFHPDIVRNAEATLKKLPMDWSKARKSLDAKNSELRRLERSTDSDKKMLVVITEIERLKKEIIRLENHPHTSLEMVKTKKPQWADLEHFSTALFYSVKSENDAGTIYPPHVSETILLAYGWKKAASKNDVLVIAQEVAKEIPTCIRIAEKPRCAIFLTLFYSIVRHGYFPSTFSKKLSKNII